MSGADRTLEVRDLEVVYGQGATAVKAVKKVSFCVAPGEIFGLVGESGSGKSTIAKAIMRLVEPVRGDILFGGESVTTFAGRSLKAYRRRVQMIFQDPYGALNPRLKVGASIREVLRVHGLERDVQKQDRRVCELFESVGLLPDWRHRYPHEFSGGQRQRICIARALALEPELIVADEPVSALDVSVQAEILKLLARLREEHGLGFLFVSHDLAVVRQLCDRVAVMCEGELVEQGVASEVIDAPQHPYTQSLLDAVPVF